jgi:hypothetical protein
VEPQHRNSPDFARLLGRCPATRSATAAATHPVAQREESDGRSGAAGWGDHSRHRSHSGLVRHVHPSQTLTTVCVKRMSINRITSLVRVSQRTRPGGPFSTTFSPISEGFGPGFAPPESRTVPRPTGASHLKNKAQSTHRRKGGITRFPSKPLISLLDLAARSVWVPLR